jgi:hypothetical protein
MELPDAMIADWVARAGDRQRRREIPLMFAINPDPELLEEWANDAVEVTRYALEATLRLLLTPFQQSERDGRTGRPVRRRSAALSARSWRTQNTGGLRELG